MQIEQALAIDRNNNVVQNVGTTLIAGQKAVTATGTAVLLLPANTKTLCVTVKALADNTGDIYVGDSTVDSTHGFVLDAGEEVTIYVDNAEDAIYIDSGVNGEGVSYIGWYAE